jgi:hypothetical protein
MDHVNGRHIPTGSPYLSITDCPERFLRIVRGRNDCDIAVVDLSRLRASGKLFGRTTDLGYDLQIPTSYGVRPAYMSYATRSHILVDSGIPDEYIMGCMSSVAFRGLCANRGISSKRDNE